MTELNVSLHPGQAAIYNSDARLKVVVAGRRFGKSYYAARALGLAALQTTARNGKPVQKDAGVYYIAPTFDQAKRVMWPNLQQFLGYERHGGLIRRENANDGFFELINGRRIYIKGADNQEALRGEGFLLVVLDEYADMKAMIWDEILEPALMDYEGDALFIGTPKGKNHFYKMFMTALEYDYDPLTEPYRMYEAFHFKSADNPTLARRELERMLNKKGASRDVVRQELEASFVSSGGRVISSKNFPIVSSMPSMSETQTIITMDPAGFTPLRGKAPTRNDESVITTTLVSQEGWVVTDMQHGHWDTAEAARRFVMTAGYSPGCKAGIEKGALANAMAPYLEDYMREFNRYITIHPLTHGNQRKVDRIVWALQGRSERGKIQLLEGPWNQWFLDQIDDFPDPLSHDDGPDCVAYVDQLATPIYFDDNDVEEWEPLDLDAGY